MYYTNTIKRALILVLAIAFSYALSAGCGGSDSTNTGGPSTVYTGGGDDGNSGGGTLLIWLETPSGGSGAAGDGEATISWSEMTDAESYTIYYSTDIDTVTSDQNTTATAPPKIITGLTNGTTYYFVIAAVKDGVESNKSDTITVTPALSSPTVPGSFSITAGNRKVSIGFSAVTKATSYKLYYDTTSGITKSTPNVITLTDTSYIHTRLTNYTTYYYRVSAINAAGESDLSGESSAQPAFAEHETQKLALGDPVGSGAFAILENHSVVGKTASVSTYELLTDDSLSLVNALETVNYVTAMDIAQADDGYFYIVVSTLDNSPAAYLYRSADLESGWTLVDTLSPSDIGDGQPYSVAISKDYVAVGVSTTAIGGTVYFWSIADIVGGSKTEYKAENPSGLADEFGYSVGISGSYIVAGAPYYDMPAAADLGAIYFIDISTPASPQISSAFVDPDYSSGGPEKAVGDHFGWSVAIDNDKAVAGNNPDDGNGEAAFYMSSAGSWRFDQIPEQSLHHDNEKFGFSVSISGDFAVVGAYQNDDEATNAGAAFVFRYMGTQDEWQRAAKLTASDAAASANFGYSVDISGSYIAVGTALFNALYFY